MFKSSWSGRTVPVMTPELSAVMRTATVAVGRCSYRDDTQGVFVSLRRSSTFSTEPRTPA